MFGVGVGAREMLMLTLGTGVGGGIICGGRPYRGAGGAAGELGHIMVDVNGPQCPGDCPNRGCLEAYVSGTAMSAMAMTAAQAQPSSGLGRALRAGETVDSRLLTRLAVGGDDAAVALLARCGEYLGAGLVTLVNIFNPELIVVGGGAAAAGDLLLEPARRVLAQRALRPTRDQVQAPACPAWARRRRRRRGGPGAARVLPRVARRGRDAGGGTRLDFTALIPLNGG